MDNTMLDNPMSDNTMIAQLNDLTDKMHDAEKSRTLEEQVAYLKSKGIDPAKSYRQWDDEKEDW